MKKTKFNSIELLVSERVGKTYEDMLKKNGVQYSIKEIDMSHLTFSIEVTQFHCYEISYIRENGTKVFAYSYVIGYADDFECKTFVSEVKLSTDEIIMLEECMAKDKLVYEPYFEELKKFTGFDHHLSLHDLIGTFVEDEWGTRYEFYEYKWFPEGIYGNVVYKNGERRQVIIIKPYSDSIQFILDIEGNGWKILDKNQVIKMFGEKVGI